MDHEIVVVDKSDQAPNLSSVTMVRQQSNGLGRAVLEGLDVARGEWVAIMDGDFSHRPEDLAVMVRALHNRDFVLGSRYARGGRNLDAPLRRVVSRIFNLLARLILGLDLFDPMSGFIVARADVFLKVRPNPIGFKINLELIYRSKRLGLKGQEVPVIFRSRLSGRSKAGVREAIRTISYILALRVRE
jgi:dolichol-phosphate mannosyltransferase